MHKRAIRIPSLRIQSESLLKDSVNYLRATENSIITQFELATIISTRDMGRWFKTAVQ